MGRKKTKQKTSCIVCGTLFLPKDKESKYCSRACYLQHVRRPEIKSICKQCGKTFIVGRDCPGIFCSNKCSGTYNRAIQLEKTKEQREYRQLKREQEQKQKELMYQELKQRYKELKQRYYSAQNKINNIKCCADCGKQFIAKTNNQKFCCNPCFKKHDNARRDKRIYRNGKPDLSISLTKLYMRDMGICQLCGKHIDFDCDSNSNDYPSIDHIKPIAKGGLHSWDNVQLACRGCNRLKSDKIIF